MNHFVFTYLDKNRSAYPFESESEFSSQPLKNAQDWIAAFVEYCEVNSLPFEIKDKLVVTNAIKAYLGLQLYGENCYSKILTQIDPFVQRTLDEQRLKE